MFQLKKIIIVTTLREFKNDVHHKTQIAFLNSIKNQTYQNYEIIVTEFFEKNTSKHLKKLNLKFRVIKSKLLNEVKKSGSKYSHWEFVNNAYKVIKKDQNIVISTLSDVIFEKNFFEEIINSYQPYFSGTSWPQINYENINGYKKGKKYDIVNQSFTNHELLTPLHKLMSDVYFFDGNILLNKNFIKAWKKCKIHGVSHGFVPTIWFCFFNDNRINIYFTSKLHNIINYKSLQEPKKNGTKFNKHLWKLNDKLFTNFCKIMKVKAIYWKKNETFRKIFIFSSFKVKANIFNKVFFYAIVVSNIIRRIFLSLKDKTKKILMNNN